MPVRPSLIRNIPFWILLVASAALTGVGAWLSLSRLANFEQSVRDGATDQAQQLELSISSYTVGPSATIGAIILGAGIIGLLLTLSIAALSRIAASFAPVEVDAIILAENDEVDDVFVAPAATEAVSTEAVSHETVAAEGETVAAEAASDVPAVAGETNADEKPAR